MSKKNKLYTKKLLLRARKRKEREATEETLKTSVSNFVYKHNDEMRRMLRGVDTSGWD